MHVQSRKLLLDMNQYKNLRFIINCTVVYSCSTLLAIFTSTTRMFPNRSCNIFFIVDYLLFILLIFFEYETVEIMLISRNTKTHKPKIAKENGLDIKMSKDHNWETGAHERNDSRVFVCLSSGQVWSKSNNECTISSSLLRFMKFDQQSWIIHWPGRQGS